MRGRRQEAQHIDGITGWREARGPEYRRDNEAFNPGDIVKGEREHEAGINGWARHWLQLGGGGGQ